MGRKRRRVKLRKASRKTGCDPNMAVAAKALAAEINHHTATDFAFFHLSKDGVDVR